MMVTFRLSVAVIVIALLLLVWQSAAAKSGGSSSASSKKSSSSSGSRANSDGRDNSKAALPRSKAKSRGGGKGGGNSGPGLNVANLLTQRLGGGALYRVFREMKTAFGSELEALTLQLTRPVDAAIPEASLDELAQCFEAECDNPQFTVSLLAKLSRKLVEPSVYTKLKSLLCLHRLVQAGSEASRGALLQCTRSLRSEVDSKVGMPFFSDESLASAAVGTVGEARASDALRDYISYVLDLIDCRGEAGGGVLHQHHESGQGQGRRDREKERERESVAALASGDRAEMLMALIDLGAEIESTCGGDKDGGSSGGKEGRDRDGRGGKGGKSDRGKASAAGGSGTVRRQILEACRKDRTWLLKQLKSLSELGDWSEEPELQEEMQAVLGEYGASKVGSGGAKAPAAASSAKSSGSKEPKVASAPAPEELAPSTPSADDVARSSLGSNSSSGSSSSGGIGSGSGSGSSSSGSSGSSSSSSSKPDGEAEPSASQPAVKSAGKGAKAAAKSAASAKLTAAAASRGLDEDDEETLEDAEEEDGDDGDNEGEDEGKRPKASSAGNKAGAKTRQSTSLEDEIDGEENGDEVRPGGGDDEDDEDYDDEGDDFDEEERPAKSKSKAPKGKGQGQGKGKGKGKGKGAGKKR